MDRAARVRVVWIGIGVAALGVAALWATKPVLVEAEERAVSTHECVQYCAVHWEETVPEGTVRSPAVRGFSEQSCVVSCQLCERPHCLTPFK